MENRESDPLGRHEWSGSEISQLAFTTLAALVAVSGLVWVVMAATSSGGYGQIAVLTATGSAFILIGSAGQAFDEMRRSLRAFLQIRPSQHKKARIPDRGERLKFLEDQKKALIDSMRKARNWLWILGGSMFILAASIGDALNH